MLDDIALFIHIADRRGLSAAAASLNVPPATVTRRLKKLEERLGCQLILRSARKFRLTSEGEAYYRAYADLVREFEGVASDLEAQRSELKGPLSVLAPTNISVGFLQPMWSAFIARYPEIVLRLYLSNETKDMLDSRVDLALRIGPQRDSQLFQKRLGSTASIIVASPDYLAKAGTPESLDALQDHRIVANTTFPQWVMTHRADNAEVTLRLSPSSMADDIGLVKQLARDGHGVALLPVSEVVDEIWRGKLRRILTAWQGPDREFFAVWPTGRLLSLRAACLRDFMAQYIGRESVLQGGMP
ncbi:LysR family transcriptional regulator [Denitrobaculum tricleocarpae]|uniref:LysR family transcriptional regulator n=1 Tax=Denitrobaculum tricleocarpae TaxID=2591009 RepID=A0A545TB79_9PROT|nr:LysR family transcriptional regulator [Denitrobaculum tricleocarpae]TQV74454.1 LysR family transcriptional regulator [Denitrobaculum tricleocarpae]